MKPWVVLVGFLSVTAVLGALVYTGKLAPEVLSAPVAALIMWLQKSPLSEAPAKEPPPSQGAGE